MTLPYPQRQKQLLNLVQRFGLTGRELIQWQLLDQALVHPTASVEANYEQLEFVGDAVIRLTVAEFLLETRPNLPVGEFAAIRSILVSDRMLAKIAEHYRLDQYLVLGDSAAKDRLGLESRLAESFEAVLAALYLSTHSLQLIRPWLDPHLQEGVVEILNDPARQNYKAALQEWSQGRYKLLPEYRVQELEPVNAVADRFAAEVWLKGERLGWGSGRSIKAAEQAAAQVAFRAVTNSQQSE